MDALPPLSPAPADPPPPPPGRRSRWVTAALLPALVGGVVAFGVSRVGNDGGTTRTVTIVERSTVAEGGSTTTTTTVAPSSTGEGDVRSVQQVVRDAAPGVVLVEQAGGLGTGFLIDTDGHILTNAHVVESASTVTVTYEDGTEQSAKVLASDPTIDLAVLDVDTPPASARVLPLGRSKDLQVGDPVVAIGNPRGLERSATTGIVSALKRQICSPNENAISNAIQTDAAINKGNSGGPLLDRVGRVIGINSQIYSESGGNEGLGFAVPIDTIRPVAETVIAGGKPQHAWIGIVGQPITPAVAKELGIPGTTGVALRKVDARGPAKTAGLKASSAPEKEPPRGGDIIVEIAGIAIRDFSDLSQEISSRRVGETVKLVVLRDAKRVTIDVTLADRPADLGGSCQ